MKNLKSRWSQFMHPVEWHTSWSKKNFLCPFYEYNIGENRDRVVPEIFAEHSGLVLIRSEVAGASYGEISELWVC